MSSSHEDFHSPKEPWVAPGQINHFVADLTAQVAADVTLAALQQKLGEQEQWLPIDGSPDATIGALVNLNSTGPLRLGFGAWRDLLLGMQFLNGEQKLVTVGGLPLKNVAGYDLTKFMVGQSGFFAEIKAITVRTYRRPAGAIVVQVPPDRQLISKIYATPLRPQWALLDSKQLTLGYLGDQSTLDFYRTNVKSLEPTVVTPMNLASEIKFRADHWRTAGPWGDYPWVFRASVPPTRISDFITAAQLEDSIADPAFGIILGGADEKLFTPFRKAATAVGGSLSCRSIPDGRLVAAAMNPSERAILDRIKNAFDHSKAFPKLVQFSD